MIKVRYQTFCAPLGALPVIAPFRGCASHQFTGGLDLVHTVRHRNRPAAPLVCRSSRIRRPSSPATYTSTAPAVTPAPAAHRHPSAPAPVPAPRKKSARLPAEVLKLQDFSFYQSISNFVVSLPNLCKKDVKGLLFRK